MNKQMYISIFVVLSIFGAVTTSPLSLNSNSTLEDLSLAIDKMVLSLNLSELSPELAKLTTYKQLTACVPESPIGKLPIVDVGCLGPYTLASLSECYLVLIQALSNVTGELNIIEVRKSAFEDTTLSAAQKSAARATLEACINSDFVIPAKYYEPLGPEGSYTMKYSQKYDPLRLMACVSKASLQNVCIP